MRLAPTPFICLVALFLILVRGAVGQAPPKTAYRRQDNPQGVLGVDKLTTWSLDETPNPNATDHLVFETVYSLLQHWPNIRMRNGHNIVPGIIPEGTLLYHGTDAKEVPSGVEWVSLDHEHAYYYCQGQADLGFLQQGCWQLMLTTTRPLRVVYFDGKSAAKIPGALDTQDLLAFGESRTEDLPYEARRSKTLCSWGKNFGVDGFVRMEMAFEVILCDFASGVSIVSFSNIVAALGLLPDTSPTFVMFEALNSGGRHNRLPGETRVQLDLAGLVSFYDTELIPSLVPVRIGQERWDHRAQDVSKEDLSAAVSRLETALLRPSGQTSGLDWKTLIQVLIDRYARRLELTHHLLNSSITSPDEILGLANKVQLQLRITLTPYLHLSAIPMDSSDKKALCWTAPIYKDCATAHTNYATSKLDSMTDSEKLLLRAVQGTNREICRVVTKMWAAGVYAGIDPSLNTRESMDIAVVTRVWKVWGEDLNRLMTWLDWSVWVKCKPSCGPEEICFLHAWPWYLPRFSFTQKGDGHIGDPTSAMAMERFAGKPFRPQPRCISLVNP